MKYYVCLLLFVIAASSYGSISDTTLMYDLNFDGKDEKIKLVHSEIGPNFELWIGNTNATDVFMEGYASYIEIIDMDRNDNLREVVVKGLGSSDQTECFFYQYVNGKVISCGYLGGNFGITAKGDKILRENVWMGFWGAEFEYEFDTKNKSLTRIYNEFYDVNVDAEVNSPFPILVNRFDQSPVSTLLKPGTKITLVKADISPVCRMNEDDLGDVDNCDWYLIRTSDGREGWCRLRDFRDFVDGLIWAG